MYISVILRKRRVAEKEKKTGRFLTNLRVTYKGGFFCLTKKNLFPSWGIFSATLGGKNSIEH
jgi:hypothetical protein